MPPLPAAHPADRPWTFSALLVLVTLALGYILLPFYGAILWGVIIALLFAPLHLWLLPRVGYRPTLAALLTLLIVLFIVVLPMAAVATALASEAALVYARLQSGEINPALYFRGLFDALPNWVTSVLDRFGLVSFNTLQGRLTAALTQGTQVIATQTFSVGQNTFEFFASVFITFYLAFFLIRDGESRMQSVWQTLPLASSEKEQPSKEQDPPAQGQTLQLRMRVGRGHRHALVRPCGLHRRMLSGSARPRGTVRRRARPDDEHR